MNESDEAENRVIPEQLTRLGYVVPALPLRLRGPCVQCLLAHYLLLCTPS